MIHLCILNLHIIQNNIIYTLDMVCPLKKVKHNNTVKKDKGWITRGILVSGQRLKDLDVERKQYKTRSFDEYYRRYKSIYKKVIKVAKAMYVQGKLERTNNFGKEAWQIVNKLHGRKKYTTA